MAWFSSVRVTNSRRPGTGFSTVSNTLTFERDVQSRHNGCFDLTYVATLGGQQHTFKGGYALNRVGNDVESDYPDGRFLIYWGDKFSRGSVTNARGTYGYYTWEDGIRLLGAVHSRNQAMYVQDTWHAGSRLTLNLGVRTENEFLPPFKAEVNGSLVVYMAFPNDHSYQGSSHWTDRDRIISIADWATALLG